MTSERPTCSCYSHDTLVLKLNCIKLTNRLGRKTTPAAAAPTYTCPRAKLICGIDKTGRWFRSKSSTCSCCSHSTLAPRVKLYQTDRYIRSENHTCSSSSHGYTEGHTEGHTKTHRRRGKHGETWRDIKRLLGRNTHNGT